MHQRSGANVRPSKIVIIVHGGAGDWPSKLHKQGLSGVGVAADRGFRIVSKEGSALDAVEAAIVMMENNPVFNAGRGSTLNLVGEIETDAAIMDGKTLKGGGVALLRDIRNPIKAARIVMDKTDHVLLAGEAARKLALANGLAKSNLRVSKRVHAWKEGLRKLKKNGVLYLSGTSPEILQRFCSSLLILSAPSLLITMETWPQPVPLAESHSSFPEESATARYSAPGSMQITSPEQQQRPVSESKR